MAEACFFLLTARKLFGMNLSDLRKLGKEEFVDWESISPPPFDFCVDLPHGDERSELHHFVFDSKLYLARGGVLGAFAIKEDVDAVPPHRRISVAGNGVIGVISHLKDDAVPSCEIYQFDADKKKFTGADSIPALPTPFAPCFMGNIISGDGDVHLLVCYGSKKPELDGLWVLSPSSSSSSGKWKRLSPPPPVGSGYLRHNYYRCFVSQDKLFLQVRFKRGEHALYSFDTGTAAWTRVDDDIMRSFDMGFRWFCFPSVTISLPGLSSNCSVALSCMFVPDHGGSYFEAKATIHAFLVNNQNGAVLLYQSLEECVNGIQPNFYEVSTSRISLVDLGNGMLCALFYGYTPDHDCGQYPVLCISVFTLTMAEPHMDSSTEAPRKEQNFLSVQVQVKRVFTMKHYEYSWWLDSFLFTPKKELSR